MISGKAIKYGNNVNTDVILPGKYLILTLDPMELAKHAMEGLDPLFFRKAQGGAIIVAGRNFGCGSSREEAPLALKHAGVSCVLAESFARIFYRNAINLGLPVLECSGVSGKVEDGDELVVNLGTGTIKNRSKNLTLRATQLPEFVMEILGDGGLIEHLRKRGLK
ncbi:MAG: 3-isopropylmalate dehydratase small subunit [Candidatus Bathyarchaeota archaeon]|nr:MAG: 3-isopropylmalate dehydratase small subunit [Candidatus Bathyarchaeota archaeon]